MLCAEVLVVLHLYPTNVFFRTMYYDSMSLVEGTSDKLVQVVYKSRYTTTCNLQLAKWARVRIIMKPYHEVLGNIPKIFHLNGSPAANGLTQVVLLVLHLSSLLPLRLLHLSPRFFTRVYLFQPSSFYVPVLPESQPERRSRRGSY